MQQKMSWSIFFVNLAVFEIRGAERGCKPSFCAEWEIFISHPILMGFVALDSSQRKMRLVFHQISPICYRFWENLDQSHGKIQFFKNFYFLSDFNGVNCKWFLVKKATKNVMKHFFVNLAVFEIQGAERGCKPSF